MTNPPSPIAWSYLALFGGIAIILIGLAFALRNRRNSGERNSRIAALDQQLLRGEIDQQDHARRRAELLIEDYERHRAA